MLLKESAIFPLRPLTDVALNTARQPAEIADYYGELMLEPHSRQISFNSGAVGYSAAQLRLRGQLYGETNGNLDVTLPSTKGAILLVRREALTDTRLDIYKSLGVTALSGANETRALMNTLYRNELHGVMFLAVASFFRNAAGDVDVSYSVGVHTDGALRLPAAA